jgi:pimeloyl-ACP methyl ester carboxylesterase
MDSQRAFYKSERGYKAITSWYDSLVDQFTFEFESRYVDTRFGKTHMLVTGRETSDPLILVQAIAGSAPLWYHQMPFFGEHYRVYALDTPGQPGRSDPNPPSFLKDGYSDWLLDVLDDLNIDSAYFAGVSSAGWYVMKLAIRAPGRVKKIVMISPTGLMRARFPIKIWLTRVMNKKKDAKALEDDLSTRSFMPSSASQDFDRQLARAMALATRHYQLDKSLGIYDERRERIKIGKSAKLMRTLFFPEPKRTLKQLRTPGLVILGEHEMLYNAQTVARKIQRSMPTLNATIIPETGHSAMYDRPEMVNNTILTFLQGGTQAPQPRSTSTRLTTRPDQAG